jgi:hypothetical protein
MKKVLIILTCFIAVLLMVASFGCSKKTTSPAAPDTNATATKVAANATATVVAASANATATAVAANATATQVSINATATAVAGAPLYEYTFDAADLSGWSIDSGFAAITSAVLDTTTVKQGAGSVALTLQITGGAQAMFDLKNFGGTVSLAGKKISAWIYIPATLIAAGSYAMELFIQGKSDWSVTDNNWLPVNGSGFVGDAWNYVSYTIPNDAGTTAVQAIGFNMQQNGAPDMTTSYTINIDDVQITN